jgi:hypothetical protein
MPGRPLIVEAIDCCELSTSLSGDGELVGPSACVSASIHIFPDDRKRPGPSHNESDSSCASIVPMRDLNPSIESMRWLIVLTQC